jgi:hypothetical protein
MSDATENTSFAKKRVVIIIQAYTVTVSVEMIIVSAAALAGGPAAEPRFAP